MKVELMKITPQQAKIWLGNNFNNRNISPTRVRNLAQQIKKGLWQLNGETIKISKDDTLLDGQHRLHAIIEAGKTIETYVCIGADKETFKTIDTGKSRGGADILSIAGFPNAIALTASVRIYKALIDGYKDSGSTKKDFMSNSEILEFVKEHPTYSDAVSAVLAYKKVKKLITPSLAGCVFYIFNMKSATDCLKFFHCLETGEDLKAGNPIYTLREKLIELSREKVETSRRVRWHMLYMIIIAWNAYRKKQDLSKFVFPAEFRGYPVIS